MRISTLSPFIFSALVARAALYPTAPTESTVVPAGRDVIIHWTDDENQPRCDALGKVRVDLFVRDDENLVSTLARGVNPSDFKALVRIETYFGVDGSDYYLRFTPSNGQAPIYTAKFAVTGMDGSPDYRQKGASDEHRQQKKVKAQDFAVAGFNSTSSINTSPFSSITTVYSSLKNASAHSTLSTKRVTTVTATPMLFTSQAFQAASTFTPTSSTNGAASTRFQRPSDGSGLGSIGIMYLAWPFLMGVAMAL